MSCGRVREGAGLEGCEVAVDGRGGLGEFGVEGEEFVTAGAVRGRDRIGECLGGFCGERAVCVSLDHGCEDGGVELVGGYAFSGAAGGAVADSAPAGVVAVPVEVSAGGGADVVLATDRADDLPAEEVVGASRRVLRCGVVSSGFEDLLGLVEECSVDDVSVRRRVVDAAEADLADVGAVS
ncbi:hypothetical protein [Pseudofrankia sp. DC12]|uniref:hypothetical protein n=1 Tax=Pseudofrankia sp. DC12 TaxID=683315 RepID=UPI0012FA6ADA|nr:hypothetical protein [Pseudofrankia sp. DC12]